MKTFFQSTLVLITLALLAFGNESSSAQAFWAGGRGDQHSVLAINADGSCLFSTATVMPRATAEQQIRMVQRFQKMSESSGDADDAIPPKAEVVSTNEVKPFTDDELVQTYSNVMIAAASQMNDQGDSERKFNLSVNQDMVTVSTTNAYPSLEEMFKHSEEIWRGSGFMFGTSRLETDTNGLLRLTLSPPARMQRYFKSMRSGMKVNGTKINLTVIFPGRVVSSGLSGMQTNATWLSVDAQQDDSLDALAKIYAAPVVVTAEMGGLKLDQPLDSTDFSRSGGEAEIASDLPITDAGPGFVAEAQSITISTLHIFPGGEDYFAQSPVQTGAVVSVKMFAPKGRTLKSVSNALVLTATDNQGRSIEPQAENGGNSSFESRFESGSDGSPDNRPLQFNLQLQLPLPDAQSIDKISAEAVAVSVGSWKEMNLTNVQANATNAIDLSSLLPGAKMVIKKISSKDHQFTIEAVINGTTAVKDLELHARVPGNDQFNANSFDRESSVSDGKATRKIQISGFSFSADADSSLQGIVINIRYPDDVLRQRVKFELKGLDLL